MISILLCVFKNTSCFATYKMSQYFPEPYEPFGGDINVKVDLSSYATEADIKNISHVDASGFALKTNLASLKAEADKSDIEKLAPVPTDLSKLSDVVKNVVKKDVYNKLVGEVNNVDTSKFVLKTKYDTDKSKLENKVLDTSGFVKKTNYDAKIADVEGKIPLATKTALTTVENNIPDVSSLVKKKQIITLKLLILKINLIIIIMINILLLQNLIL